MEDARTPKGVKSSSLVHTGSRRDADSVSDTRHRVLCFLFISSSKGVKGVDVAFLNKSEKR